MFLFKKNKELESLKEIDKKKEKVKKEKVNVKWIAIVSITAFIVSVCLSFIAQMTIPNFPLWLGIIITLLFIGLGIMFDIIGVAVTTADEAVFHSPNSFRIRWKNLTSQIKKIFNNAKSECYKYRKK